MSSQVVLSQIEMELASIAGMKRHCESKANGRIDNHGLKDCDFWGIAIEGAAAEMAYCKFRNKFWTASIGSFKGPDNGDNVQIRSTPRSDGSLILRNDDNSAHYYVLVVGRAPHFTIAGWILGADGKNDKYMRAPSGRPPAFFVPQSDLHKFKNP